MAEEASKTTLIDNVAALPVDLPSRQSRLDGLDGCLQHALQRIGGFDVFVRRIADDHRPRNHGMHPVNATRCFEQHDIARLVRGPALVLLCGRYEGVDERLIETEVDEELSLGDYVLSGGELAAMVVIDAMTRQVPGALGHEDSAGADSFSNGLLDCPHYTRPERVAERRVPEVLLSGDHEKIRRWRQAEAEAVTEARRPDLWARRATKEQGDG